MLTAPPPPAPRGPVPADEIFVPGGTFVMGTSAHPWALDNERPAHRRHVDAFWLDTFPVTNARLSGRSSPPADMTIRNGGTRPAGRTAGRSV